MDAVKNETIIPDIVSPHHTNLPLSSQSYLWCVKPVIADFWVINWSSTIALSPSLLANEIRKSSPSSNNESVVAPDMLSRSTNSLTSFPEVALTPTPGVLSIDVYCSGIRLDNPANVAIKAENKTVHAAAPNFIVELFSDSISGNIMYQINTLNRAKIAPINGYLSK